MTSISTKATVHGAISIVNAIATGKGSALGISLVTTAEIHMRQGEGKIFNNNRNSNLFKYIIHNSIPKTILQCNDIFLTLTSDIPIGFGLKSSSAVSSAVSLACYGLVEENIDDFKVLDTAVNASRKAKITITGAYDDTTACYFGGFVITDNYSNKLLRREKGPLDLLSIILLPNNSARKNPLKLKILAEFFEQAIQTAENSNYWKAMTLNGLLVSSLMGYDYTPILLSIENGALSASISGNGPSIAVIIEKKNLLTITNILEKYGKILVCKINNTKASIEKKIG
ncbi:MAG TPA: shikimate kinase [Nitrososphaeraceae archaeon]|nr:shikimate kinase [Nitrososphaeraceae archaeon]